MKFKRGDEITVTSPVEPSIHKGGETGTVTATNERDDWVEFRRDDTGAHDVVWPSEISHR